MQSLLCRLRISLKYIWSSHNRIRKNETYVEQPHNAEQVIVTFVHCEKRIAKMCSFSSPFVCSRVAFLYFIFLLWMDPKTHKRYSKQVNGFVLFCLRTMIERTAKTKMCCTQISKTSSISIRIVYNSILYSFCDAVDTVLTDDTT